MLRSVKHLEGVSIAATDGAIGKVKDFYFDDESWVIRYAVVNTGTWLGGREVLLSPHSIGEPAPGRDVIPAHVTREQVRNSPGIDTDQPISRQYERGYLGYYGYPYYWGGTGLWGAGDYPGTLLTGAPPSAYHGYLRAPSAQSSGTDPHLRSCNAVKGYRIHASDGEIGHVEGFLVDSQSWSIRYLIVNTSNWWLGHRVLVSPEWMERVSWLDSSVTIDLDRQAIRGAPAYDGDALLDRDAESSMYDHYGRDGYWRGGGPRLLA